MAEMTVKERFARMYAHKEADRVPIIDSPWAGTIRRWQAEGMPEGMDWCDYFGVDKTAGIGVDITPQYPYTKLEETETTVTYKTNWGVTLRYDKGIDSTPEFLDYTVTTPETWEECKKRMYAGENRINWDYLKRAYPQWQAEGRWIVLDYGTVLVHIFHPEDREFYHLEKLWDDGQNRIQLPFDEED